MRIFYVVVGLVSFLTFGNAGEKKGYELKIKTIEIFQEDKRYAEVEDCELSFVAAGQASWTFQWNVKKQLPALSMISIHSYELMNEVWGKSIYELPPVPVNTFLGDTGIYKDIRATGNFPDKFPVQPGTYSVNKFLFNDTGNMELSPNQWRFDIILTCLDGIEKITILYMQLFLEACNDT